MDQGLFPALSRSPHLPDGFEYRPGVLSAAEERAARRRLARLAFGPFEMRGFVARREVAYFGYAQGYDRKAVKPGPPLPAFLRSLRERAAALAGLEPDALVLAVVIRYPAGAGIGWHRDAPAFGTVVGLSLGAPARLQLREGGPGGDRREIVLAPGSGYVLARAARWDWQHHVPPVRAERYAVTFRTLRGG